MKKEKKPLQLSLRTLILILALFLIFSSYIIVGISSLVSTHRSAENDARNLLDTNTTFAVSMVSNQIENLKKELHLAGNNEKFRDETIDISERQELLMEEANLSGFSLFSISDVNGITYRDSNIADREYFQKAMAGTPFISSPLINRADSAIVMMAASALPNNEGAIYGAIPYELFISVVENISVGETGYSFILDKDGIVINHPNTEIVEQFKTLESLGEEESDSTYFQDLSALTAPMTEGESDITTITLNGEKNLVSYKPIEGPEGWSLAIVVPRVEMLSSFFNILRTCLICLAIMLVIGLVVVIGLSNSLSRPVAKISERYKRISEGDLKSGFDVGKLRTKEFQYLTDSSYVTVTYLNSIISDIDYVLNGISEGLLNVESKVEYKGDFKSIINSMDMIRNNLSKTISTIEMTSHSLSSGSTQISSSAKNLAKDSVEAASSLQHLSSGMDNINDKLADTVADTISASSLSDLAKQSVEIGNGKMKNLLSSMQDITQSAENIRKINQTIDEIAFQTNILALNAAVEAARAGTAGRGFSVVADEVRNLATKCSEAAANTSVLIDKTISAINAGLDSADDTASELEMIMEQVEKVNIIIMNISDAAVQQASAVDDINNELDRISNATNSSSSASLQLASTSDNFESQSNDLRSIVSKFQVKN